MYDIKFKSRYDSTRKEAQRKAEKSDTIQNRKHRTEFAIVPIGTCIQTPLHK